VVFWFRDVAGDNPAGLTRFVFLSMLHVMTIYNELVPFSVYMPDLDANLQQMVVGNQTPRRVL